MSILCQCVSLHKYMKTVHVVLHTLSSSICMRASVHQKESGCAHDSVSCTAAASALTGDAAAKAKEREKAKAELAKKAGVPSTFQWPKEKKDIPLESSGNKEVDEGDGDESAAASTAQAKPAAAPVFSFGGSGAPAFSFTKSDSSTGAFSFGAKAGATPAATTFTPSAAPAAPAAASSGVPAAMSLT